MVSVRLWVNSLLLDLIWYLAAVVNEVKSFAYTVNSQLFIHTLAKLLILYGLWGPFLCPALPFDVHPVPWPNFLSCSAVSEDLPAALLVPIFVSSSGPCYFYFFFCVSPTAFVSQLSKISDRETSQLPGKDFMEDVCCCSSSCRPWAFAE